MKTRTLLTLAVGGLMAIPVGVAHATPHETIEPTATTTPVQVGGTLAQSFRPTISGQITEVTLWAGPTSNRGTDRLSVFAGPDFATEIGSQSFERASSPQVVRLDRPIDVTAGTDYLIKPSEIGATSAYAAVTDPYAGGEVHFLIDDQWRSWTDLVGCGTGATNCPPFHLDLQIRITIERLDADGDGVTDDVDLCPDTVLPDEPSRGIGSKRFAATDAGFIGADGVVVHSLRDTGGCSAFQIIDEMGIGAGHKKNGITRPHLDAWVTMVAAISAFD